MSEHQSKEKDGSKIIEIGNIKVQQMKVKTVKVRYLKYKKSESFKLKGNVTEEAQLESGKSWCLNKRDC